MGTLRSVQVAVEKSHYDDLSVSVLRILYLIYCIYVCRSQRPMAGVRLFHRPNLRGLNSAANAPKARTGEQSRAVWRWAAYSTPK